jgi:hypothetical protein
MQAKAVSRWFGDYLATFAACGRGDRQIADLLPYYGVPLLLTTDDGVTALTTADDVAAVMQGQLDGLRAAGFHHSDVLHSEVTMLNAASAICRCSLSRIRSDGIELERLAVTYLVTDGPHGPRISVLAAHTA